jgi:hypothetical protein
MTEEQWEHIGRERRDTPNGLVALGSPIRTLELNMLGTPTPTNGTDLTEGVDHPNGTGLTEGPGMVNGLGYTAWRSDDEHTEGLHLVTDELQNGHGSGVEEGLELRRALINGFSIEAKREKWEPSKGRWWSPWRLKGTKRRLEEMAKAPLPSEEGSGN